MKNIIIALGFFLEGAARIFDFAGALSEEGLHETHDMAAIRKDWVTVGKDFSYSSYFFSFPPMVPPTLKSYFQSKEYKNSREFKNGIKKKRNGKSKR